MTCSTAVKPVQVSILARSIYNSSVSGAIMTFNRHPNLSLREIETTILAINDSLFLL